MQFRLWHLGVLVAIVAGGCGLFVWWREGFVHQHEARRYFESKEALFSTVPAEPRWLEPLVGADVYYSVSQVSLADDKGSLERLSAFPTLELLGLPRDCRDKDLAVLASLPNLTRVDCHSPHLTLHGIERLRNHPKIKDLRLNETAIDDEALEIIGTLSQLDTLFLDHTKVSDKGLAHLKELNNLRYLSLAHTAVTDSGLMQLAALPNLTDLCLDYTHVRGSSLRAFKSPPLTELFMTGCPLEESSIDALNSLPALFRLAINETPLSPAALNRIRQNGLGDLYVSGDTKDVANEIEGELRRLLPGTRVSADWVRSLRTGL